MPELPQQALTRLKKQQDVRGHVLICPLVNVVVRTVWGLTWSRFAWAVFVTGG
jgi:hypothetical protein